MKTSYTGFEENVITVEAASTLTSVGVPVKIDSTGKAAPVAAGDIICGVCVNLRNGYAGVAVKGYVTLPSSGTVNPGWQTLAAASATAVKTVTSNGRGHLVLESGNGQIGFIL